MCSFFCGDDDGEGDNDGDDYKHLLGKTAMRLAKYKQVCKYANAYKIIRSIKKCMCVLRKDVLKLQLGTSPLAAGWGGGSSS